jgi:hypothetical protein
MEKKKVTQSEKALVKLSVSLISTLNHIAKKDYLDIISRFDNEGKKIFEKNYQFKDFYRSKEFSDKANYCLKNDYTILIEDKLDKKKRYLDELIELNALDDLTTLTEFKDFRKFKDLLALKEKEELTKEQKFEFLKEIKEKRSLNSLKQYKGIEDFTLEKELTKEQKFEILKDITDIKSLKRKMIVRI